MLPGIGACATRRSAGQLADAGLEQLSPQTLSEAQAMQQAPVELPDGVQPVMGRPLSMETSVERGSRAAHWPYLEAGAGAQALRIEVQQRGQALGGQHCHGSGFPLDVRLVRGGAGAGVRPAEGVVAGRSLQAALRASGRGRLLPAMPHSGLQRRRPGVHLSHLVRCLTSTICLRETPLICMPCTPLLVRDEPLLMIYMVPSGPLYGSFS